MAERPCKSQREREEEDELNQSFHTVSSFYLFATALWRPVRPLERLYETAETGLSLLTDGYIYILFEKKTSCGKQDGRC